MMETMPGSGGGGQTTMLSNTEHLMQDLGQRLLHLTLYKQNSEHLGEHSSILLKILETLQKERKSLLPRTHTSKTCIYIVQPAFSVQSEVACTVYASYIEIFEALRSILCTMLFPYIWHVVKEHARVSI